MIPGPDMSRQMQVRMFALFASASVARFLVRVPARAEPSERSVTTEPGLIGASARQRREGVFRGDRRERER